MSNLFWNWTPSMKVQRGAVSASCWNNNMCDVFGVKDEGRLHRGKLTET